MKIDTSKVVRAVVERTSGHHLFVLTSDGRRLTLGQDCGMVPKSSDEWDFAGHIPAKQEDAVVIFGEDSNAAWVHAEAYAKALGNRRLLSALCGQFPNSRQSRQK